MNMEINFFYLLLILSFLSLQSEAHFRGRSFKSSPRFLGKFSRPVNKPQNLPQKYPYDIRYFEQPLDHFGFADLPTFRQRYLINFDHWVGPDRMGPIFFYCGNEGDIEWFAANTGFVWELTPRFGALVIFPEHRYYGESMPYGSRDEAYKNASTLAHLTAEQALADFAVLITDLKRNLSAEASPVILFGGSYGGMLAAWMRLKYPHIVIGALASSAPILQFEDIVPPETFYNIVSNDFKRESTSCFNTIKESWNIIMSEGQKNDGLVQLGRTFHLCRKLQRIEDLSDWLESAYSYLAMVDYPYPSNFLMPLPGNPIKEVCRRIDCSPDGSSVLERIFEGVSVYYNYTGEVKCFDLDDDPHGMSGWNWQACTEMVMPMSSDKDSSMFPEWDYNSSTYEKQCWEDFHVKPRPTWITTEFGGHDFKAVMKTFGSNIIFSNGLLDPWSGGSVLENISETIVALTTEKENMSFITPPLERYPAKVSCRSKLSVVDDVYKKLDEEHKKLFLDSAFGKLYGIKENMNPSNVLLHVLVMLRIESPDENELWFCIGGQKVRFGLSDYTLITGLYSGDESDFTKDIPTTKKLFNEYFEERKKAVRPEELKEAFSSAKSELDRYKLGLAVIYESVLRAKERSTSIDTDFLNIVDNLELFNNYPWGSRSYPNLLTTMKKLSNKDGVKTNTFYGFPLAMQVWVFELFCNFPGFEDLYQLEKIGTEVPRMCNWKSTGNPSYEEIIEILDIHHDVALVPLVPNDAESCLRYVHGFPGTWCTIYTYSLEEQPTEEEVAPANDLIRVILDVVTSMQQKLNDNFIEINRKIDDHSIQIRKIDDRMIEMNQKINELVEARREQTPSHHWQTSPLHDTMMTPPHHETMMETTEKETNQHTWDTGTEQNKSLEVNTSTGETTEKETEHTKHIWDTGMEQNKSMEVNNATGETTEKETEHTKHTGDTGMEQNKSMEVNTATGETTEKQTKHTGKEETSNKYKRKRIAKEIDSANILDTGMVRVKKPSAQVRTPYTTHCRVFGDPIVSGIQFQRKFTDGMKPDLFMAPDSSKITLFKSWLKNGKPIDYVMRYGHKLMKDWFKTYVLPQKFLQDLHIDLALRLMRERQKIYPSTFDKYKRAILDAGFTNSLIREFELYKAEPKSYKVKYTFMDIHYGTWNFVGRPWVECEKIYFPVKVKDHWFAVEFELRTGKLTVYDPDRSHLTIDEVREALTPFTTLYPLIAMKAKIEMGTITIDRDILTQEMKLEGGDSAIYALKYIEFLSIDESPYYVTKEHISNWRKKFAVDVFCSNMDP